MLLASKKDFERLSKGDVVFAKIVGLDSEKNKFNLTINYVSGDLEFIKVFTAELEGELNFDTLPGLHDEPYLVIQKEDGFFIDDEVNTQMMNKIKNFIDGDIIICYGGE